MLSEIVHDVLVPRLRSTLGFVEGYRVRRRLHVRSSATVTAPIFVVGVPRSGTTLLYRVLSSHRDLAWFSYAELPRYMTPERQAYARRSLARRRARGEKIPATESTGIALRALQTGPAAGKRWPIEATIFWKCLLDHSGARLSPTRTRQLVTAVHDLLESQGRTRFVGKSPYLNDRLPLLTQAFPDAKFVHIVRDPRAVVASAVVRRARDGVFELAESGTRRLEADFVERCAREYRETLESIRRFAAGRDGGAFLTLSYETLIEHRDRELTRLLRFCGLDAPASMDDLAPPMEDTRDKWKATLEDGAERKVLGIVGSAFEEARRE